MQRGAFRLWAGIITEARRASRGSIQRLSSPEKMPGCSSREARLHLSSRRTASVIDASADLFFHVYPRKRAVWCPVQPLEDAAGVLRAEELALTTAAGHGQHGVSAESRSAARRPAAPRAPLRAHEDRLGVRVAARKGAGKGSRAPRRFGCCDAANATRSCCLD